MVFTQIELWIILLVNICLFSTGVIFAFKTWRIGKEDIKIIKKLRAIYNGNIDPFDNWPKY